MKVLIHLFQVNEKAKEIVRRISFISSKSWKEVPVVKIILVPQKLLVHIIVNKIHQSLLVGKAINQSFISNLNLSP